ncbi:hypothetical protein LTR85_005067 [Meristemomyces frigidus]|nr:hypothetical protein LTR85_005067 [Meristemomyces frigidus]
MTAAIYRSTPTFNLPQTQNTALVLEFNCLYTHDIRRKQKRWQDGFLRYHTFNKRIMLYDVPRNFIGDTHWKADEALQDGDEVTLDKDGVMVQVAEAVGRTETDLTELRKSKNKSSSERGSSPPARAPQTPAPRVINGTSSRQRTQLKHRSLNALLGTPKGSIGKAALPAKSPFELRHDDVENEEWEQGQPPKRQRMENLGAWNVTRTRTSAAPRPDAKNDTPSWARTADAAKQKKRAAPQAGQRSPPTREVVDLRDDDPEPERFLPGLSSDALIPPSSPPREKAPTAKQKAPVRSSSPAFQTQRAPSKRATTAAVEAIEDEAAPRRKDDAERGRAPPQSANDAAPAQDPVDLRRYGGEETLKDYGTSAVNMSRPMPRPAANSLRSTNKGLTLRISAKAPKKKMLLCQDQLASKPKRVSSTNTEAAADRLLDAASDEDEEQPRPKSQRQLLEERLARIRKKEAKASVAPQRKRPKTPEMTVDLHVESDEAMLAAEARAQSALQLAELDKMILADDLMPPEIWTEMSKDTHAEVASDNNQLQHQHANLPTDIDKTSPSLPVPAVVSVPARKKVGVGRREIRVTAQSCFQKPAENGPSPGPVEPEAPPSPQKEDRQLRRVVSDTNSMSAAAPKRIPGVPMRFTPSPSKRQPDPHHAKTNSVNTNVTDQVGRPPKPRLAVKKPLQRAVSLNTTATGTSAVLLGRPFQPPKPPPVAKDLMEADVAPPADAWSREAFDLFAWRPPGWDEEKWCLKEMEQALDGVSS